MKMCFTLMKYIHIYIYCVRLVNSGHGSRVEHTCTHGYCGIYFLQINSESLISLFELLKAINKDELKHPADLKK